MGVSERYTRTSATRLSGASLRRAKARPVALYIWIHYVVMLVPGVLLIAVTLGGATVLESWLVVLLVGVLFLAVALYKIKLSRDIQQAVDRLHEQTRAFAQGRPVEPLHTAFLEINDISAAFAAADRERQATVDELNHRGKNMLAKVQLIVVNAIRSARSLDEAAQRAVARVQALKRMDDLLLRHDMRGASLHEVFAQELGVYETGRRIALLGGDMVLDRQTAEALGLIAHELATNSAKYGSLRDEHGSITVSWDVNEGCCVLTWIERGTPAAGAAAAERGFGSDLLERTVGMLKGTYHRALEADGLKLSIAFPYGSPGR